MSIRYLRFSTLNINKTMALFFIFLLMVFSFESVSAHSIHVDVLSQQVELEAYYGDGKPVKNGEVTVYKPNGDVYLTGKTDDDGLFSFEIYDLDVETLTIEVKQLGHREEIELKIASGSKSTTEEGLPIYQRAIAGLGYIIGLAGILSLYFNWRMKRDSRKQEECKLEEAQKQERAKRSTDLSNSNRNRNRNRSKKGKKSNR